MTIISDEELLRRTTQLASIFNLYNGPLTDTGNVPIMVCLNADPTVFPTGDGMPPVPKPASTDTLARCDVCRAAVWIGPIQKAMGGIRACYICATLYRMLVRTHLGWTPKVFHLDPAQDSAIPRRTTAPAPE